MQNLDILQEILKTTKGLEQQILESNKTLENKINEVNNNLNQKIDDVENKLNQKIDSVENNLNQKIDSIENSLNQKIDENTKTIESMHKSLLILETDYTKKTDIIFENVCEFLENSQKNRKDIKKLDNRVELLEYKIL